MKREGVYIRFVSVLALGLFLGMGMLSCGGGGGGGGTPPAPPPPPTYSLSGFVTAPSSLNLEGTVRVCLSPDTTFSACNNAANVVVASASNGSYVFSGLSNGSTHYVAAYMDVNGNGLADIPSEPMGIYGVTMYNAMAVARPVKISGADASANITLLPPTQLPPRQNAYSISGTATYAGSMTGSTLLCASLDKTFASCAATTYIDTAGGAYIFDRLPNGTYYIAAFIDVNGDFEAQIGSEPMGIRGAAQYYDMAGASPVTIDKGNVTSKDFAILDAPSFVISGTITSPKNMSNLGGTIHVCRSPDKTFAACTKQDGSWSDSGNVIEIDANASNKSFAFSGLADGSAYYLAALMEVNGNGRPDVPGEPVGIYGATAYNDATHALPVTISNADATGITIQLVPSPTDTYSITGTVSYSGTGTTYFAVMPNINAYAEEVFTSWWGSAAEAGYTGPGTTYTISGLPNGTYNVAAYISENDSKFDPFVEPFGLYGVSKYFMTVSTSPVTINNGNATSINFAILNPPTNYNANLNGEYIFGLVGMDVDAGSFYTGRGTCVFDGSGGATLNVLSDSRKSGGPGGSGPFAYSVESDNSLRIDAGSSKFGIVSHDGSMIVVSDTEPADDNELELVVGVKKSTTPVDKSVLQGDYIISQIGANATGVYTSRVSITSNGDGTGTWTILADSSSSSNVGLTGTFAYTVDKTGTFSITTTINTTVIGTDYGIVSADGSMFVLMDSDPTDGDGEVILAVGVKKSTGAPALTGSFEMNQIGWNTASNSIETSKVNIVSGATSGTLNATIVGDSEVANIGISVPATVVMSPDGTFTIDNGTGSLDHGMVSSDGRIFTGSDASLTDGDSEIIFSIAVKK
jgi:hypothetical protein